ncbi:MAG: hypothetical protein QGG00_10745, partial [Verrucomicrobiota bacterium]|nr:hypothetical protein [Verrucomicrobiota bacterium]
MPPTMAYDAISRSVNSVTLTRSIKRKGGMKGKEGACHSSSDGQLLLDVEFLDALAEGRAGD